MSSFIVAFILSCLFAYSAAASKNYEILTLAENWPQTTCWNLNRKWPKLGETPTCSPCVMPLERNKWTLHGLWPSNRHGQRHPQFCNKRLGYNQDLVTGTLRQDMEQKWTNFRLGGAGDGFWGHEWNKHGTCASDLPSTNTQTRYLTKSLGLLDENNVEAILRRGGIYPNRPYDFQNLYDTIRSNFGSNPFLSCAENPNNKQQYLAEVHLCFDKTFRPTNCDTLDITNCNRLKPVTYPLNLPECSS